MRKTTDNLPTFDFEVVITAPDGRTETITIGRSPSEAEACQRALSWPTRTGHSARVEKTLREHAPYSTPLSDCTESFNDGHWELHDAQGRLCASEHGGGHLVTAYEILIGQHRGAAWKTIGLLKTLRQAIREQSAQMMPIELPRYGATHREITTFLRDARAYDRVHHGQATF